MMYMAGFECDFRARLLLSAWAADVGRRRQAQGYARFSATRAARRTRGNRRQFVPLRRCGTGFHRHRCAKKRQQDGEEEAAAEDDGRQTKALLLFHSFTSAAGRATPRRAVELLLADTGRRPRPPTTRTAAVKTPRRRGTARSPAPPRSGAVTVQIPGEQPQRPVPLARGHAASISSGDGRSNQPASVTNRR